MSNITSVLRPHRTLLGIALMLSVFAVIAFVSMSGETLQKFKTNLLGKSSEQELLQNEDVTTPEIPTEVSNRVGELFAQ